MKKSSVIFILGSFVWGAFMSYMGFPFSTWEHWAMLGLTYIMIVSGIKMFAETRKSE